MQSNGLKLADIEGGGDGGHIRSSRLNVKTCCGASSAHPALKSQMESDITITEELPGEPHAPDQVQSAVINY
eukprot:216552-Pelagomonas_calceolata.AAC.6